MSGRYAGTQSDHAQPDLSKIRSSSRFDIFRQDDPYRGSVSLGAKKVNPDALFSPPVDVFGAPDCYCKGRSNAAGTDLLPLGRRHLHVAKIKMPQ